MCAGCFVKVGPHKRQHVMAKEYVLDPMEVKDLIDIELILLGIYIQAR